MIFLLLCIYFLMNEPSIIAILCCMGSLLSALLFLEKSVNLVWSWECVSLPVRAPVIMCTAMQCNPGRCMHAINAKLRFLLVLQKINTVSTSRLCEHCNLWHQVPHLLVLVENSYLLKMLFVHFIWCILNATGSSVYVTACL